MCNGEMNPIKRRLVRPKDDNQVYQCEDVSYHRFWSRSGVHSILYWDIGSSYNSINWLKSFKYEGNRLVSVDINPINYIHSKDLLTSNYESVILENNDNNGVVNEENADGCD